MKTTVDKCGGLDFLVNNGTKPRHVRVRWWDCRLTGCCLPMVGGGQFPSPAAAIRDKGWDAVRVFPFLARHGGAMTDCRILTAAIWAVADALRAAGDRYQPDGNFPLLSGGVHCPHGRARWFDRQHCGRHVERFPGDVVRPTACRGPATCLTDDPPGSEIRNVVFGCMVASHTGAARAGVVNMTKTLAVEWAASGVRVNSVAPVRAVWCRPACAGPWLTHTALLCTRGLSQQGVIFSKSAVSNYDDPSLFKSYIPFIPAKRLGTPEEVAAAVVYLLSPAAAFTTGECMCAARCGSSVHGTRRGNPMALRVLVVVLPGDTLRVDGGSSLYASPWPIPPHQQMPPYGDLPEDVGGVADESSDEATKQAATAPRSKL